jgi:AAA15 family ATPase/GTPase
MFSLKNFKNFKNAELDIDNPTTIIVGPNGAGKSNLIEALELLSFVVSGRPLYEVTDIGREGGLEIRGGLDSCAGKEGKFFTLGYSGVVFAGQSDVFITYRISIKTGTEPRIQEETLTIKNRETPIFEIVSNDHDTPSADNIVRYDNYARGMNKPSATVAADRSALSQYARFARGNKKLSETLDIVDAVSKALTPPTVFDPIPKLMRGYERQSETRLARNGFNISPVLADLFRVKIIRSQAKDGTQITKAYDQKAIASHILKKIAQLPDEPFSKFDFIKTKAGDVMFGLTKEGEVTTTAARVLSDGTLRALAVICALETSAKGQRVVVEEFDNGVHPSRVRVLVDSLFSSSRKNELRSIVTTHNPATLNSLSNEELNSVILIARSETSEAELIPLPELPGYIEFIEQGRLGDLITKRVYESHLRGHYEEGRIEEIENWINDLP